MTKIMIIDSAGAEFSPGFRARLPGVTLRGLEPKAVAGQPVHPHGLFCAWLAALPMIGARKPCEIVCVRIFDEQARMVEGSTAFMLEAIRAERPNYISRSWGVWDEDSTWVDQAARGEFAGFAKEFAALQADIGFVDFGASGNEDDNDADPDVVYPQVLIAEATNIIGACGWDGVPMRWSGDGHGVRAVMVGHKVYSPGVDGKWVLWSGTSAATPKACGAAAADGLTHQAYQEALRNLPPNAKPVGAWTLPHPKWGWGCDEDRWQRHAAKCPAALLPPHVRETAASTRALAYMEFTPYAQEMPDAQPEGTDAGGGSPGEVVPEAAAAGGPVARRRRGAARKD